jgi:hypothetical protein
LSKGSVSVTFDRVMKATNGFVSGIKLLLNESSAIYNTLSGNFHGMKFEINEFHKMLEYYGSVRLKKTAKIHNLKLNSEFKICDNVPSLKLGKRV